MSISTVLGASRPVFGYETSNESGATRAARCLAYPLQLQFVELTTFGFPKSFLVCRLAGRYRFL